MFGGQRISVVVRSPIVRRNEGETWRLAAVPHWCGANSLRRAAFLTLFVELCHRPRDNRWGGVFPAGRRSGRCFDVAGQRRTLLNDE
jgi:hypothetical protein